MMSQPNRNRISGFRNVIGILMLMILCSSCQKDTLITPRSAFTLGVLDDISGETQILDEPYIVYTGQTLVLSNEGDGDFFSFYPGETLEGQSYQYAEPGAIGINFNNPILQYSYSSVGNYKAVVLASAVGDYGEELERDLAEFEIEVTENKASLDYFAFHSLLPPLVEKGDSTEQIIEGVISDDAVELTVPFGSDLSSVIATFEAGFGRVYIGDQEQTSGISANDFSTPLDYRIVSYDGSVEKTYTVIVHEMSPSPDKAILSFQFELKEPPILIDAEMDEVRHIVSARLPYGVNMRQRAIFSLSEFATAYVDDKEQISGISSQNFSNDVVYTIQAQDGSTKDYTARISTESSINELRSFVFNTLDPPVYGNIKEGNVSLDVPAGTDVSALVADFKYSLGSIVTVDGVLQESGVTSNDFTNPVHYVVIGWDGTPALYTVTVSSL